MEFPFEKKSRFILLLHTLHFGQISHNSKKKKTYGDYFIMLFRIIKTLKRSRHHKVNTVFEKIEHLAPFALPAVGFKFTYNELILSVAL